MAVPDVACDQFTLLVQPAGYCPGNLGVPEPVQRMAGNWLESSAKFVFALRSRVEKAQAVVDSVLNSLIVARLKMQEFLLHPCTPVAAIQRVVVPKINCSGNDFTSWRARFTSNLSGMLRASAAKNPLSR